MIGATLISRIQPSHRHWYVYDVLFHGEAIVTNSRDPEHDLARALRARGMTGVVQVFDANGKPRSRVNIERAAKFCMGSNLERYAFKPSEAPDSGPHAGERVFAHAL